MLQQFNFQDHTVRVVLDDDNQPMFVAKDVATILGYANTNNAINTHCGGGVIRYPISDSLGRSQVNKRLGTDYKWQPLQRYCENENILPEIIYPNGYTSISAKAYPYDAWLDVYELDLNLVFGETL